MSNRSKKWFKVEMYSDTNPETRIVSTMSNREFFDRLHQIYRSVEKPASPRDKMICRRSAVLSIMMEAGAKHIETVFQGPIFAIGCDFLSYMDGNGELIEEVLHQ